MLSRRMPSTAPTAPVSRNTGDAACLIRRTSRQRPSESFSETMRDTATGKPAVAMLKITL